MAPANSPLKRVRFETDEESDAVRDGTHRIAQPRGGRRTPTASSRRPLPSSMSTQKQLPGLGQTNGTASSNSGGFSFGQQQPAASQSFPPFGNAGSSSSFAPPSSSFSFGAQPSSNPFSTNSTFGGNENSIQTSAQAQTQDGQKGVHFSQNLSSPGPIQAPTRAQADKREQGIPAFQIAFSSDPLKSVPQTQQVVQNAVTSETSEAPQASEGDSMHLDDPNTEMVTEPHPTPKALLEKCQDELLGSIVEHVYNFLSSNLT